MKVGPALLSLSYRYDGRGQNDVNIEVRDKVSGVVVFSLRISGAEFTNALSSFGNRPAQLTIFRPELVGYTHEIEHVKVPLPELRVDDSEADKIMRRAEELQGEGWRGSAQDLQNGHNVSRNSGGLYEAKIVLHRYVSPDGIPYVMEDEGT